MRSSFFGLMIREWAILNKHNIQMLHYGLEKWCQDARVMEFESFGIRELFQIVKSNKPSDLFVLDVRKTDFQAFL